VATVAAVWHGGAVRAGRAQTSAWRGVAVLGVLACGVLVASCAGGGAGPAGGRAGTSRPSATTPSSVPAPTAPSTTAPVAAPAAPPSGLVESAGPGWAPSGLDGPVPAPGSCRMSAAADGAALPDPSCTPGAIDATVTQANLSTTLCRPGGYTSSVRPPVGLTEPYKYAAVRAYGDTAAVSAYELDHLVPLEVGGSSDTRNLWPEPDDHPSPGVANSKDPVENRLHDLVCAAVTGGPSLPLASAQRLIAADWTTALVRAQADMVPVVPG
jgi:hypothetical protein